MGQLAAGLRKEITFGRTVHCTSIENYKGKHHFKCPSLILNYLNFNFKLNVHSFQT